MNRRQQLIRRRGNDCTGSDHIAIGFPTVPDAGESEGRPVFHLKEIRLRGLLVDSLPLVKTIRGDQAAPSLERFTEGRFLIDRLDARVDESLRFFTPERN